MHAGVMQLLGRESIVGDDGRTLLGRAGPVDASSHAAVPEVAGESVGLSMSPGLARRTLPLVRCREPCRTAAAESNAMSEDTSIRAINERLAQEINREARTDPNSPCAHKFVGIANGKVVVVADTWREVDLVLEQVEPDPTRCYAVDASADYDRVEVIWGVTDSCRSSGVR
jgi:hypothetical protein